MFSISAFPPHTPGFSFSLPVAKCSVLEPPCHKIIPDGSAEHGVITMTEEDEEVKEVYRKVEFDWVTGASIHSEPSFGASVPDFQYQANIDFPRSI